MIQIYDVGNTNYNKNGDIVLTPISATIHPILNGAWEAELTHPIDKEGRWKHIVEEAVVKMPGFYEHWEDQLFRIKTVEKQDSGVTATMEPIFYDAMGDCFLTDVRAVQESGQQALTTMLSPNAKYSASSNITKVNTAYYNYVNFLEALNGSIDQSFIKRWGGEILYNNFQVVVNEQVGGDYGVELRYGKNIPKDGMQFTADVRDIVTRLYPKAYNGRKLSGNGHVDSPLINNYPVVMAATLTFENIKLRQDMEDSENVEENVIICENQEELDQVLTEQCQAQFKSGIDKPKITISVDMVLLQNTEQYKDIKQLETVSLGDIVHCRNTHLGITNDARVIELEYDCIRRKVTSVVLGDYEYDYFDDVSSTTQIVQGIINPDGSVMAERVQGILNGIYTQLRLQSTAAQKVDGVAFKVEDLDTTSPLYGCMIWGTQGIQISTKRTADGRDWDWTTAITAQGIVANAIVTGLLSDKTGNNYWDLDTGEFRLSSTGFEVDGETLEQYINDSLNQQQIFNKLTNNGQLQGIYMQDGLLYINGSYIKAGIITDNVGKNYWNLNTGEFRLSANSTVGGQPIATQNNTIKSVDVEYAVGDSDTTAPTSGWSTASPQWQAGKYIWQRTVTTMQDGTKNISDPTCIQGAAGQSGESVTIESNTTTYAVSDSGTETPEQWQSTIPAAQPGQYLWSKTETKYSDGSTSTSYGVTYQGINGTDGTDGNGIVSSSVQYQIGDSSDTPPTGRWTDNIPDMQPGDYLWTRTQFTYSDGSVTTTYSVSYLGENGSQGIQGPPGENGQTLYTWIKYADTPTSGMSDLPDGKAYLGIAYNKTSPVESENYEDYQWSDIKGEDGVPGTPGENGETLYTWIKYATDASGSNMSDSPAGCSYIGIAYNKNTPEESSNPADYAWSLIQGEAGIGVESVVDEYYLSNSEAEPSGGFWTTTQPEWKLGFYIWTRSAVTYTSGETEYTDPILAQAINSANQAVSDLDSSLNQEGVFNRLTNNGQTQGIYLQDGILYINASYIASGTLKGNLIDARNLIVKDSAGNTTFAVDANGNVSIRCTSFSLNGSTISSIANSAANNAYQNAKDYTDQQLNGFTPDLTQEEVFNALTNNGQMQGIYMENGYLYINASYIDTGNLAGWIIDRANRKIYCSANTVFGTTTITLDAGNGEISVVNNSRGVSTTIDHYGVESTSGHYDNLWADVLLVGTSSSGNSSLNVTSKSFTLTIPAYMGNISTSGTVALNGTTRIGGTLNIPGAMNTNGKICFGADGVGDGDFNVHDIAYFYKDIYYANAPQTGGGDYVRIGSSGRIFRQGSSSRRYKNHVRYMDAEEAENLYNIPVIFFKYKDGYLSKDDPKIDEALPGFYAEDIAEYIPGAADYKNIDGQRLPENWDSRYLIPYMVKCIQEQHKEIKHLKETNKKILQALASAGIEV